MTVSFHEAQTHLVKFEKERARYYVEKRLFSSRVDGLEIDKATFGRKLSGLQYNYDGALAKEKKVSVSLETLRAPVKKARCDGNLLRSKVPTYIHRFKTDLHDGFAEFLTKLGDATK